VPVGRGVYARPVDLEKLTAAPGGAAALRIAVATTVCGPRAVGSHRDAAEVHGLDLLTHRAKGAKADPVAVTRPPEADGSRTAKPGILLHTAVIPADHQTISLGVPLTSVARTVVDLARSTPLRDALVVADSALRTGQATKADLTAVLDACARWPGIGKARQVVGFSDARAESAFESIARLEFHLGGLPPPDLQVWVGKDGVPVGRVDFLWRKHSTIAEADGATKYADPERARLQLRRDADLRAAGFEVVHFGWQELWLSPSQVIDAIRAAFTRNAGLRSVAALRSVRLVS
jgi:hypothetical protein